MPRILSDMERARGALVLAATVFLFLVVGVAWPGRAELAGRAGSDNCAEPSGSCASSLGLQFPSQFSAELEVESHLLDHEGEYPPRTKVAHIYYDFQGKRAKANITVGYEAGVTYIRRYDLQKEYLVDEGPYPQCKRSYLGETMPAPTFSVGFLSGAVFKGSSNEEGLPSCTES